MTAEKISGTADNAIFYARLDNITTNDNNAYPFELTLELSGSTALTFHSRARQSDIRLTSNWDSPSFFGATLPMSHKINGSSRDRVGEFHGFTTAAR